MQPYSLYCYNAILYTEQEDVPKKPNESDKGKNAKKIIFFSAETACTSKRRHRHNIISWFILSISSWRNFSVVVVVAIVVSEIFGCVSLSHISFFPYYSCCSVVVVWLTPTYSLAIGQVCFNTYNFILYLARNKIYVYMEMTLWLSIFFILFAAFFCKCCTCNEVHVSICMLQLGDDEKSLIILDMI